MKALTATMVLAVGLAAAACSDNETSFFIEHAKVQPTGPECNVSVGDNYTPDGVLDLALARSGQGGYTNWYLVRNQLIAREDEDNLRTETNGIMIDGMETYAVSPDGSLVGTTEYFEFGVYIEPKGSGVAPGIAVAAATADALGEQLGCPALNGTNYPADLVREQGVNVAVYQPIYSVVRFLGHTLGGTNVETPEFTFQINLCCGCLVDWSNCRDACSQFCETPTTDNMCYPGVGNGDENRFDCRWLYHNPGATWEGGLLDCSTCS